MENRFTKNETERINCLEKEISELKRQITQKQNEIDKIFLDTETNYEGSFIEYFDSVDYYFMYVKRQRVSKYVDSDYIVLEGPTLMMSDSPLYMLKEADDDGIDIANFTEEEGLCLEASIFENNGTQTIRKITKKDMQTVVNYYNKTLKKTFGL